MQLSTLIAALGRFLAELQRRKVLRIAAAYVVGAWIVLQVSLALQTAMSLSGQFSATMLALLVIGFFVAVVLAWFYEITPEGVKRTALAAGDAPLVKPQTTDLILAGALALVVIVAVAQALLPGVSAPSQTTTTTAAAEKPKVEPPALGDKSIAVLPFANLSADPDDAVFADGLTEEVLNVLAQIRELRLISRTSSLAFKNKSTPVSEIARQLGVRHILEGSVRRDGDNIRITAQLIDVASDTHLWSKTYERKADNVFAVQDQIARAIANALDVELAASAKRAPTTSLPAYRVYLQARERFRLRRKMEDLTASITLYKRAIELDPKFAEAYSGMGQTYFAISSASFSEDHMRRARIAAETASALDPLLAQPYALLSGLARAELDWESALALTNKAMALNPSESTTLYASGIHNLWTGRISEAVRDLEEAQRVDPLYAVVQTAALQAAFAQADDDACLEIANKLVRSGALYARTGHFYLAYRAVRDGDSDTAEKHYRAWADLNTREPIAEVLKSMKTQSALPAAVRTLKEAREKYPASDLASLTFFLIGAEDEFLDALAEDARNVDARHGRIFGGIPQAWHILARSGPNPKFDAFVRSAGLVGHWKKHGWPDRCRPKGEDDFECS